jgi:prevent-host-death family protein
MRAEMVTTLKRQATQILAELHQTKEPVLITEQGIPSAYLIDVDDYELMKKRMQLLELIAKGERDIEQGNTLSHENAKENLSKWQ